MRRAWALLVLVLVPLCAWADDAQPEQDAAATGRGGTGTAALMGASSLQYNPANLSRLFAIDAAVGVTGVLPLAAATDSSGVRFESRPTFELPPHAYVGYGNGKYGFAAGINAPFGRALRWPDDFSGEVLEEDFRVLAGHVGGAYQLLPQLSAGATLSLYRATLELKRRTALTGGTETSTASGFGVGATFGLSFAPAEFVRFGLTGSVPSRIALDDFSIPARVGLGTALYFEPARVFVDADWQDGFGARVGAEVDLTDVSMVRAGVFFDQKQNAPPAQTLSSLPDSDRLGASVGAGLDLGLVSADLAYVFTWSIAPESSASGAFPARYELWTHALALTLRFATPPGVASRGADTSTPRTQCVRCDPS